MSFYDFGPNDIVKTSVVTFPKWTVSCVTGAINGSIYLERPYLDNNLATRLIQGFSERLGGLTSVRAGLTASISIQVAVANGTNQALYSAIRNLYQYYSLESPRYILDPNATQFGVVAIPQVYYDRCIRSGTFVATDISASTPRTFYDDGIGGLHADSPSGSLVGALFYSEGIGVFTGSLAGFGTQSATDFQWSIAFAGTHTIPVNIYRCRAPGGQLNASSNPTFYTVPASGAYKNTRQVLTSSLVPYITAVGIYDHNYELVAVGRLAQPIRKDYGADIAINLKLDW